MSTHDHRLLLTAGLFALFGLPGLQTSDVTFDKVRRVCTLRRFDVVRLQRTQFAFADILDVRVERLSFLEGDEPGCRLSLVTRSGVYPMSSGYKPNAGRHEAMRTAILDALSVD